MTPEENNGFVVNRETWNRIPQEQRDWLLFDTMTNLICRLKSLERWNKTLSFSGGVVGGALAAFGIKMFG